MYELLYNMYFCKFMKENRKETENINWNKWNFLNSQCDKYYELMNK